MKLRSPVILGLAFDERGISCAEVFAKDARREQRRLGRFTFAPGATLAEPADCGRALRAFLDEHKFDTRRAVLGVPAKWLITNERDVPPAGDVASSLAVLRMHAERIALGGNGELVTDIAGDVTKQTTRALIVGILRPQLDRLLAVATAAGLDVVAVTATSLVVHAAAAGDETASTILVGDAGTELVSGSPESPRVLRHISTANPATESGLAQLGSELRRTLTLSSGRAGPAGVRLYDGLGLAATQRDALAGRAGVSLAAAPGVTATLAEGALNGAAGDRGVDAFAAATALAIAGTAKRALPVDFLDSRLAPPVERRFGRKAVWGVVLGVFAVVSLLLFYTTVTSREAEAQILRAKLKEREPAVKTAQATIDRVKTGRSYFEGRPPMLGAMREVTLAFNYEEPIWASSLTIREDEKDAGSRKGLLQGRTTSQPLVTALRDRLEASPTIRDVQLLDLRGGGKAGEQTFLISFVYTGND